MSCSGTGQGPICSVAPLALDFGFVTIGQHEDLAFSVTNTGGGRLTGSVAETCAYFSIVSGGSVRPGPRRFGSRDGALRAAHDGCGGVHDFDGRKLRHV